MKVYELGRSMVEMLGVLAIIGVLSVGAIAGYQKAMMKYKLNKQRDQMNTLFSIAQQYVGQFQFDNGAENYIKSYLIKLNLIPNEMIREKSSTYLYDVLNNRISVFIAGNKYTAESERGAFVVRFTIADNKNFDMCQNMLLTAKEYADTMYALTTNRSDGAMYMYFGNKYCQANATNCIRDLTLDKIYKMCQLLVTAPTADRQIRAIWHIK